MFFVIVCDDEQSKKRLRLGEAEELYAHFRPTRVFMGSKPTIAISISHPFIYHWQTP